MRGLHELATDQPTRRWAPALARGEERGVIEELTSPEHSIAEDGKEDLVAWLEAQQERAFELLIETMTRRAACAELEIIARQARVHFDLEVLEVEDLMSYAERDELEYARVVGLIRQIGEER